MVKDQPQHTFEICNAVRRIIQWNDELNIYKESYVKLVTPLSLRNKAMEPQ